MPKITEGQYALGGLTALAVWVFVALPFIYSQGEVSAQKTSYTDQPEQHRATEPRGTPAAPFFVEVVPTPKSAGELAQEAEDRDEKKSADRWLVRWTASLFFATIGLIVATASLGYFAFRQMRDMKESIAAAKQAADAALIQANVAASSLRARMVPSFPDRVYSVIAPWDIKVAVKNVGRAVGAVGDTYVAFCDALAPQPDYVEAVRREDSTILETGEAKVIGSFRAPNCNEGQYCYGFIKFSDQAGKWRRRFCVQIFANPPAGKNYFHLAGGDVYARIRTSSATAIASRGTAALPTRRAPL